MIFNLKGLKICRVSRSVSPNGVRTWFSTQRWTPGWNFSKVSNWCQAYWWSSGFFLVTGTELGGAAQLSLLLLHLIYNEISTQRGVRNRSANKLPSLLSLEECWLTGTQLKRDWFIELECSGPPNLRISASCNHHFQTRVSLHEWNFSWSPGSQRLSLPKVAQPLKPI